MAKIAREVRTCQNSGQSFFKSKWFLGTLLAFGLLGFDTPSKANKPAGSGSSEPHYYSTAAPPEHFPGPMPEQLGNALAMLVMDGISEAETNPVPEAEAEAEEMDDSPIGPAPLPSPAALNDREAKPEAEPAAPRLASALPDPDVVPSSNLSDRNVRELPPMPEAAPPTPESDPVGFALHTMQLCRERFQLVRDYTCVFVKRERIKGRLSVPNVLTMKARTEPHSIYFKFQKPSAGREAIYVEGRHNGQALVHDVGFGKLLAGTLALDPLGSRAMDGCRHPITEAGIGHMIETIIEGWEAEMSPGETLVEYKNVKVNDRSCLMIVSTHPRQQPDFLFHQVRVYIDREFGLPIRFEAYDWPTRPGVEPLLIEEYTYHNLRLNVGLTEKDFDPSNKAYSFGRF